MKITVHHFHVTKRHALTISRGTSAGSDNLLVEVEHEGITGIGEMAPTSGGAVADTAEGVLRQLIQREAPLDEEALDAIELGSESDYRHTLERETEQLLSFDLPVTYAAHGDPWDMDYVDEDRDWKALGQAFRAAVDMAMHDWQGKRVGQPLWRLLGLNRRHIHPTSVTIGINPPGVIREIVPEIMARTDAYALKVKLGSPEGIEADQAMFAAAQEAAIRGVAWRVDANGGWSVEDARKMIRWLAARDVRFVEQPLARGQEADLPAVHCDSILPIFADESIYLASDIPPIAEHIDGVNLKLMKCGGIREALRIIHTARAHGLKLMIGCMSESSLAISAAAQISPLVDALDLDSHLNLRDDPFVGATMEHGRMMPSDLPGLGVTERAKNPS